MRTPKIGDMVLTGLGELMIVSLGEAGLVSVSANGAKIDFWPGELEWTDSHACWLQRPVSASPKPSGRPPLIKGETSMRVGFAITKWQWLAITAKARADSVSFSEVVRRAIDGYLKGPQ